MPLGRARLVVSVAILLVVAGCGGSDDPLASRTATVEGVPSISATGDRGSPEPGSTATSTGADPTATAGDPTDPTGADPSIADDPTDSATSAAATGPEPGATDGDRTTDPSGTGPSTTIEVAATTAGLVATAGASTRSPTSGSSATTVATRASTVTRVTTSPTRTGSSTATTRRTTTTRATTTQATTTRATTSSTTAAPSEVLLFTRTTGYRHPSIGDGVAAMTDLARSAGFRVVASADPTMFDDGDLARFAVVVFLSTSGDVLNRGQQSAFERYIEGGGGFVGVHAATDTEYDWPWYGRLVGTWFANHPLVANDDFVDCHCFTADVVRQGSHPSTGHLPARWRHRDEWYNFRAPLPPSARILLTVDESTYPGGTMGSVHPVTWTQRIGDGRSWYTALGHTPASYRDGNFRRHLLGGLEWAAGG